MKRRYIPIAIFGCYIFYGFLISQFDVSVVDSQVNRENVSGLYDYKGSTHIDADFNGSLQAAAALNYDFITVNNLNRFQETPRPPYYAHRTLVLPSYKISFLDSRLILFNYPKMREFKTLGQAQTYLTDGLSQNKLSDVDDLMVLAHPLRRGFQWAGEIPNGIGGVEILNMRSMYERAWEQSKIFCLWSLLIYPFNPRLAFIRLFEDPTKETELWDELTQSRRVFGFAGPDDIASPVKWLLYEMRVLSIRSALDFLSTHILLRSEFTGDPLADAAKVIEALKKGHSYMSIDSLGDPTGFLVELVDSKKHLLSGSRTTWNSELKLVVRTPNHIRVPFEVALFKDGHHFMSSDSNMTEIPLPSSGVYRVVVYVKPNLPLPDSGRWFPWIYSNPFFISAAH